MFIRVYMRLLCSYTFVSFYMYLYTFVFNTFYMHLMFNMHSYPFIRV